MPPNHNQRLGRRGEDAAAAWYESQGYEILDRNWRVREGEIDLICRSGSTVAFVEVKTRSSTAFGTAAEAVGWKKQRTIRRVAYRWLEAQDHYVADMRFDVVDVNARGHVVVYEGCF